jgi:hypothetical protein
LRRRSGRAASPTSTSVGTLVRIEGRGFPEAPLPRVLVGGVPAPVLGAAAGGGSLTLRLPQVTAEEPLELAVVRADGQGCAAPAYVRVLPPGPPVLRAVDPLPIRVSAGSTQIVTVSLSGHAPPGGALVTLALEGCDVACPSSVLVPPYGLEATFATTAGKVPGSGRIVATWGRAVEVPVTVLPAPGASSKEVDLTGWTLVQTDSARAFLLPAGTILHRGGAILVARKSSRSAFEAFWGVTLAKEVTFIDGADQFPSLNGDETFSLLSPTGALVDGPTPKLVAGRNLQRKAGSPAGLLSSWLDVQAAPGDATPGVPGPGVFDGAIRITEIADPSASGQFPYEFVEIAWDAP